MFSDQDSDNTDSEISVSKLQTIKNIAAERKMTERRGSSRKDGSGRSHHRHHQRSFDGNKFPNAIKINSQGNFSSNLFIKRTFF